MCSLPLAHLTFANHFDVDTSKNHGVSLHTIRVLHGITKMPRQYFGLGTWYSLPNGLLTWWRYTDGTTLDIPHRQWCYSSRVSLHYWLHPGTKIAHYFPFNSSCQSFQERRVYRSQKARRRRNQGGGLTRFPLWHPNLFMFSHNSSLTP